jgi:hypothetical protein
LYEKTGFVELGTKHHTARNVVFDTAENRSLELESPRFLSSSSCELPTRRRRYERDEDDDSSFLERTEGKDPGALGATPENLQPSNGPSIPAEDLQPVGPETALVAQEYRDMKTLNKELLEKDEEVDKKIAALPKSPEEWGRPRTSPSDPAAPSSLLEEPDPWDTDDADPQENKFTEGFRELHDNIEGTVRALKQSADMKLDSLRADEARVVNRHNVHEDEPLRADGLKQDPLQVFEHGGDMPTTSSLQIPELGHQLDFGSTQDTKSSWLEEGNADNDGSNRFPNLRNTNM